MCGGGSFHIRYELLFDRFLYVCAIVIFQVIFTFYYGVDFVLKLLTSKQHELKHDSRHEDVHFRFCISEVAIFRRSRCVKV